MSNLPSARSSHAVVAAGLLAATALLLSACGSTSTPASGSATVSSRSAAASGASVSSAAETSGGGSPAAPASSSAAGGPSTVAISITDAKGCVATPDSVPAGAVTFNVKNVDATGITELELISDQRIVGERENLTPGFDSTFTVKVDGGSYQIYCPGGATEKVPFTVTGKAAVADTGASVTTLLHRAAVDYAGYVDNQIAFLIPPVEELQRRH